MTTFKSFVKKIINYLGYEINYKSPLVDKKDYVRLKNTAPVYKLVKLHFGCGPRILKDWINIDLKYVNPKNHINFYTNKYYPQEIRGTRQDLYCIDITKQGLPLPDNSVDIIFHEDFIEHLTQKQQILFLAETFRVMKKGTIHRINTPNLISSMKTYSNFSKGVKGVYTEEWDDHIHLNILTLSMLSEMAKMIGYSRIIFNSRDQSRAKKLLPHEYRPSENRAKLKNGNIFADLIK